MSTQDPTKQYLKSFGSLRPQKPPPTALASTSIPDFHTLLNTSNRILCLVGAGLSASSGLDTFRGDGRLWHDYQVKSIATQEAFDCDPGLCWLFYAVRRHEALVAEPNKGHRALAELARRIGRERFMCLSQNVDGMSSPHISVVPR